MRSFLQFVPIALLSTLCMAGPSHTVTLQTKSAAGVDLLSITPAKAAAAETLTIEFVHQGPSADCSFKVVTEASRLPQRGDPDDFNEAMPDGSYIRFANYKAVEPEVKALSVDISSKSVRFASITVAPPASFDAKRCKAKERLFDLVFFKG